MTDHYTYRITWSPEDEEHLGRCAEFPSLSWLAPTPGEGPVVPTTSHEHLAHPLVDLHPARFDPVRGSKRLPGVARPHGFVGARGLKRDAAHSLVANLSTWTVRSLVSAISRT